MIEDTEPDRLPSMAPDEGLPSPSLAPTGQAFWVGLMEGLIPHVREAVREEVAEPSKNVAGQVAPVAPGPRVDVPLPSPSPTIATSAPLTMPVSSPGDVTHSTPEATRQQVTTAPQPISTPATSAPSTIALPGPRPIPDARFTVSPSAMPNASIAAPLPQSLPVPFHVEATSNPLPAPSAGGARRNPPAPSSAPVASPGPFGAGMSSFPSPSFAPWTPTTPSMAAPQFAAAQPKPGPDVATMNPKPAELPGNVFNSVKDVRPAPMPSELVPETERPSYIPSAEPEPQPANAQAGANLDDTLRKLTTCIEELTEAVKELKREERTSERAAAPNQAAAMPVAAKGQLPIPTSPPRSMPRASTGAMAPWLAAVSRWS